MCKVSVIIPVYNGAEWLEDCIASFNAQSFKDFEILLIDDGSTDGSGAVCDLMAAGDPKIRVFHKENGGAGSARNLGIEKARGKYIAFTDADDTVRPGYLARLYGAAAETGADLVMCDCFKEWKEGFTPQSRPIRGGLYTKEQIKDELYGCLVMFDDLEPPPTVSNWLCLIKRSLLMDKAIRYPEVRLCEDLFFGSVVLFCAESFVYLKGEYLYDYRYRECSVSHSNDGKKTDVRWRSFLTLNEAYENYFGDMGLFDTQIRYNMLYFVLNQLVYIRRQRLPFGKYRKAVRALMKEEKVVSAMKGLKMPRVSAKLKLTVRLIRLRLASLYCLLHRR